MLAAPVRLTNAPLSRTLRAYLMAPYQAAANVLFGPR